MGSAGWYFVSSFHCSETKLYQRWQYPGCSSSQLVSKHTLWYSPCSAGHIVSFPFLRYAKPLPVLGPLQVLLSLPRTLPLQRPWLPWSLFEQTVLPLPSVCLTTAPCVFLLGQHLELFFSCCRAPCGLYSRASRSCLFIHCWVPRALEHRGSRVLQGMDSGSNCLGSNSSPTTYYGLCDLRPKTLSFCPLLLHLWNGENDNIVIKVNKLIH